MTIRLYCERYTMKLITPCPHGKGCMVYSGKCRECESFISHDPSHHTIECKEGELVGNQG